MSNEKQITVNITTWNRVYNDVSIVTMDKWLEKNIGNGMILCFFKGENIIFNVPLINQNVKNGDTLHVRVFSSYGDEMDKKIMREREKSKV